MNTTDATEAGDGGQPAFGPFKRSEPWKTWWIWLWGVVSVGLLVSVWFRAPFMAWSLAAVATFGVMEAIGLTHAQQGFPPLTQVIREFVPRWLAFSLIYASTGVAGATWFRFHERLELALLTGLLGWFTAHFDTTFDSQAVVQESTKYAWYARRVGLSRAGARIEARQARRGVG
jgi:hypothetical protein